MIPYPGESLTVRAANDVGGIGSDLLNAIRYRADSATLGAGSEWTAWVSKGWADYLDDDTTTLDVAWVVEVLSGSVTVDVSEGITATRGGSDATPISLGTHTLTVGTNVIASTFTATDVLFATNNMMVRVEGASGSAVVQQVKLRAWPTAGVAGGWSDPYPAYDGLAVPDVHQAVDRRLAADTEFGAAGTASALWDVAREAVQSHLDEGVSLPTVPGSAMAGQLNASTNASEGGLVDAQAVWSILFPFVIVERPATWAASIDDTLPIVDGVDYIRPPEEVFGDNELYLQPLGTVGLTWEPAQLQTIHDADGGGQMLVSMAAYAGDVNPAAFAWPDSSATLLDGDPLTLPETERVIFAATHSWMVDDIPLALGDVNDDWRFVLGNGGYDWTEVDQSGYQPVMFRVAYPPYRLWSPTLVTQSPHLIFFRSDALGAGAALVFGQDTRQSSGLVFGNT